MKNTLRFSLCALCATLVALPLALTHAEPPAPPQAVPFSVLALAGYAPLKGEGVVVTLRDRRLKSKTKSDNFVFAGLVHDFDLLSVVNELRAAGAKGIAVNGIRLTNQTAIRALGPTIKIGSQTTCAPFKIEAVGVAGLLEAALKTKGGLLDSMRSSGPQTQVSRASQISLAAAPLPRQ